MKASLQTKLKHHSTADWDFSYTNWYLSNFRNFDPPTALRESLNSIVMVLCKYPNTTIISEGEVRTWWWPIFRTGRFNWFLFRNQSPVGSANIGDGYYVEFSSVATTLIRIVPPSSDVIGNYPFILPQYNWKHVRIRFYTETSGPHSGELAVEFYAEDGGIWVQKGVTLYDPINAYASAPINRIGLRV